MKVAVRVSGDANEAAEAVQTGFVKAYQNIGKLRQPRRFEYWLLRIVANAAVSRQRVACSPKTVQKHAKSVKRCEKSAQKCSKT